MKRPFLLINSNTVRPPVNPLGLEYVGEALIRGGVEVEILDLSWVESWRDAVAASLPKQDPLAVGITFRNIDDCSSVTRVSFVPWLRELVMEVKKHTSAPVVLGGVGFSVAPEAVLEASGADCGIAGDGEETALTLAQRIERNQEPWDLPNLVYWQQGKIVCNPRQDADIAGIPAFRRELFDNPRYQAAGAMVGIETKRGCPEQCVYCADPLTKGSKIRLRPPEAVAQEMANLLRQEVCWYHLCDSEFNLPLSHAKAVCQAILDAGLADRVRWYTYCAPVPFDAELADLMVRAGCAGINFGVDSLCDEQLDRLGRRHRLADVENLTGFLRGAGLNFMFDLLLGGLGETEGTVRATADVARRLDLPLVGVAVGMRVYPGTPISRLLAPQEEVSQGDRPRLLEPEYYFSPELRDDPVGAIRQVLGDDCRFLLLAGPEDERNYNYVGDDWLARAIAEGARGAYWDIIRRKG
jgi:radical SAM superfamily enzyme YgiQ (UPF0313 family)